jgi:DNA helicase II / ATP-dependent DNA helicase PcrA
MSPAAITRAPSVQHLTDEQTLAAAATEAGVFIESAPGSGKTTVAAERYGYLRYSAPSDPRAVLAVSFTRAATWELRQRILRAWGPGALCHPNRVVTIDTLLLDLLHHLLRRAELTWPGGHTNLHVLDSWNTALRHAFTSQKQTLVLNGRKLITTQVRRPELKLRIVQGPYRESICAGICTHDDVRAALTAALANPQLADIIGGLLADTLTHVLVDEVFDANHLDVQLLDLACRHGVAVTAIGDPWQALYEFRGAQTHLISALVAERGLRTYRLTHSFRFHSPQVITLTRDLRERRPVTVPLRNNADLDVILASEWKTLWTVGSGVLPLSFGSPKTVEKAAATLLLDLVTRAKLGRSAVFVEEAYKLLGITDPGARERLHSQLTYVLNVLASTEAKPVDMAWNDLVTAIGTESGRAFRKKHHRYTEPLGWLRTFLLRDISDPIPGLTVHQAKGCEWGAVGVCLTDPQQAALRTGLDPLNSNHRTIYVALTRATSTVVSV